MANGSTNTIEKKKIYLYRGNTQNGSLSSTQYLPPDRYRVGINETATPTVTTTTLAYEIPVDNGTINDNGDNVLTGSLGGDNSTDNTTTYKVGGGQTDNTSQNLIANGTNQTKAWAREPVTNAFLSTSRIGFWFYVKDSTTYAKFLTSGWCLALRVGSDSSNYYEKQWTNTSFTTGWNWMSPGVVSSGMTTTGTPTGTLDYMQILIRTNNSTDTFVAGDVLYDLCRQWTDTQSKLAYVSGYPTLNMSLLQATTRILIGASQAVGYDINALILQNRDTSELTTDAHVFTAESKSATDEFVFVIEDRIL